MHWAAVCRQNAQNSGLVVAVLLVNTIGQVVHFRKAKKNNAHIVECGPPQLFFQFGTKGWTKSRTFELGLAKKKRRKAVRDCEVVSVF